MAMQKRLYKYNRDKLQFPSHDDENIIKYEKEWIDNIIKKCDLDKTPDNYLQLINALSTLIETETEQDTESTNYVANTMSLNEFKVLVQEFAVDGLTEAQVFYYILPRLPLKAQMPMLRILIDEFGSAVYTRTHTKLYINLLIELSMPTEHLFYLRYLQDTSFEFVNIFYWLTLRADDVSYFAGALTYLETIIPTAFDCYVKCCDRLKIKSHLYYSEHQHIDYFHAKEGIKLFKALNSSGNLDYKKAYTGIMLTSHLVNQAFECAVLKAKTIKKINYSYKQGAVCENGG